MASTVADRAIGAIIGAAVADAAGKINCDTDDRAEHVTNLSNLPPSAPISQQFIGPLHDLKLS